MSRVSTRAPEELEMSLEFDPRSESFRRDPYPVYRRLREEAPVFHGESGQGRAFWALTRYEDVSRVLRDPRASVDRPGQPQPLQGTAAEGAAVHPLARALRALSRVMLFRDPPDHTRLRGLVNKAFTPRMVERLAPRIRKLAEELLDARAARGGMDAIADFAAPLPLLVIAELLGVPTEDRERLKRWSDDLAIMLDGTVALQFLGSAVQAAVEFDGYLRQRIAERRRAPRDDLLSELVAAQERGEALSEDEIVGSTILLLGAGHETTTNLIGNGILCLLRHPEQLARLRGDAGLLPSAVEEFLRYESPVQATSRIFPRDEVEVGGVAIPKGEEIGLFLGAANRDPEVFPDPERFDVGRRDNRHLSFGLGIHFCLGAGLARLEGRVAFEALLERAPGLRAAEESEPVWRPGFLFRGVEALPVLL